MGTREWIFSVDYPAKSLLPGEVLCVSGSVEQLGKWRLGGLVHMSRVARPQNDNDDDASTRWRCEAQLPFGEEVKFRYCVTLVVRDKVVIRRWETDLRTRKIGCHDDCDPCVVHRFGFISSSYLVQTGWLSVDTLVELKLYEDSVKIWKKKHVGKNLFVKVTPVDANQSLSSFDVDENESLDVFETTEESKPWPIVNVAKLSDDDCTFKPQSQFGMLYRDDDFISFQAQVFDLQTVAFLVDIYARQQLHHPRDGPDIGPGRHDETMEHICSCYVLPNHFKSTEGVIQMSLVSRGKFQAVGQLSAAYIIVHPMTEYECDLSMSFARHWKSNWKGLDVGHRGLGDSYTKAQYCSNIRENTIASMKDAIAHGADLVEFDVQISKDLVPVIYHDYELVTSIVKKKGDQKMWVQMPLKNLTLEQLHSLKINHVEEIAMGEKTFSKTSGLKNSNATDADEHVADDDHEPFPTLEKALKILDIHCGFNIEIKWDMEMKDGTRESHNAFEMNMFIDIILKTVLEHAGGRKIFFSSFNPDICTMIRCKQNKYPVLLLTQGKNSRFPDYRDPRTVGIVNGSKFVEMAEILGLNAIADNLLKEPDLIQKVKARGQVIFTWTDDKNDRETVALLKKLGVDGIIYDRMDVNNSKEVKEPIFLIEKRLEEEGEHLEMRSSSSVCSCRSTDDSEDASAKSSPSEKKLDLEDFSDISSMEGDKHRSAAAAVQS